MPSATCAESARSIVTFTRPSLRPRCQLANRKFSAMSTPALDLDDAAELIVRGDGVIDGALATSRDRGGVDANETLAYDLAHARERARHSAALPRLRAPAATIESAARRRVPRRSPWPTSPARVLGRESAVGRRAPTGTRPFAAFVADLPRPAFLASLAETPGAATPRRGLRRWSPPRSTASPLEQVRPHAEHVHRANADIPESIIAGLAELGGFGLSVPEEFGGFATGGESEYLGMVVATEELSWGSLGIGGSLITRPEILTRALRERRHRGAEASAGCRDSRAARRWRPSRSPSRTSAATCRRHDERDEDRGRLADQRHQDLVHVRRARRRADVARAHRSRPRARPPRALALPRREAHEARATASSSTRSRARRARDPGGRLEGRPIDTIGYRGMHSYELSFDHWFVPDDDLVGGEEGLGRGFYFQMAGFENGRIQTAARAIGVMQAAYEAALEYARHRVVFGEPIIDFELTRVKLAHDGGDHPVLAPVRPRGRAAAWDGRWRARGVDGQGLRLSRRRVGDARGHADPRRDGLRRGVSGQSLLRRRAGAVDLRGRRRDALSERSSPAGCSTTWPSGPDGRCAEQVRPAQAPGDEGARDLR